MNGREFQWDTSKAAKNVRNHRVSFEEAKTAFDDPSAFVEYDAGHSDVEDRWLLFGVSDKLRLLAVSYTRRNEAIRIISARRANQTEARRYAEQV